MLTLVRSRIATKRITVEFLKEVAKSPKIEIWAHNILKSVPEPEFHGDSEYVLRSDSRLREHFENILNFDFIMSCSVRIKNSHFLGRDRIRFLGRRTGLHGYSINSICYGFCTEFTSLYNNSFSTLIRTIHVTLHVPGTAPVPPWFEWCQPGNSGNRCGHEVTGQARMCSRMTRMAQHANAMYILFSVCYTSLDTSRGIHTHSV